MTRLRYDATCQSWAKGCAAMSLPQQEWCVRCKFAAALAEVERLRGENAEYVRAHELMVAQFKTMQREKEHGWREAERWEDKAETLRGELARRDEQIAAVRGYAESKAITARALGHEDRPWLDLLIILERAS